MPTRHRLVTLLCAMAAIGGAGLAVPATSGAILVGVGDQKPETFTNPLFKALNTRYTRYITPWNSIFTQPQVLDTWIRAARAARLQPLIAFNAAAGSKCPDRPCKLPSVRSYARAIRAFRRKYPWIKHFQPWNEANHQSQPTGNRPRAAARFYNTLKRLCKKCKVTAADVLDSPNQRKWLETFLREAKGKPLLWGLHNYTDTNRRRSIGTETLIDTVDGEIWFTETGAVHRFVTTDGREALKPDPIRGARAMKHMFTLAKRFRDRVTRIYVYHFSIDTPAQRFDAGIVDLNGLPRPSYEVLKNGKPSAERLPRPKGLNRPPKKGEGRRRGTDRDGGGEPRRQGNCIPGPLGGCT